MGGNRKENKMRVKTIKYTAHYDEFGVKKDQWIGLEAEIDDTETAESRLTALKEIEEQWYAKQNPHLQPQAPIRYDEGNSFVGPRLFATRGDDVEPGLTVEEIKSCKELVVIDSYRLIVNMPGNEALKEAWTIRREEIVAKEVKGILDATNAVTANNVDGHKLLDGYNKNTKIKSS